MNPDTTITYQTKDSGQRRDFGTGARRDSSSGKPMIRRIPPIVRERLGGLYERGATKYCDVDDPVENWKKGIPLIEFLESLHHHQNAVEMGLEDEDHESAVLWNMIGFMWTKWAIKKGHLPEVKGEKDLVAAYNAVVREYGGKEVHNPAPTVTFTHTFNLSPDQEIKKVSDRDVNELLSNPPTSNPLRERHRC